MHEFSMSWFVLNFCLLLKSSAYLKIVLQNGLSLESRVFYVFVKAKDLRKEEKQELRYLNGSCEQQV